MTQPTLKGTERVCINNNKHKSWRAGPSSAQAGKRDKFEWTGVIYVNRNLVKNLYIV